MNAPDARSPSQHEIQVPTSRPRVGNLVVIVVLHGLLTAGALRLALDLPRGPHLLPPDRWYMPLCVPFIVLAMKGLVDRLSRWSNASGLPVATSIGAMGCSILLAISTWTTTPVLLGLTPLSPGITWSLSPPPTPNVTILALGLVLAVSTALSLLPQGAYRAVQKVTLPLPTASAVGLALLLIAAGVRGGRCPGIDTFLEQLRAGGGEVAPPGIPHNLPVGGISGVGVQLIPTFGEGAPGERRQNVGDLTVVQACEKKGCRVGLVSGRDAPPSLDDVLPSAPVQPWDARMVVAPDAPAGAVYVAMSGDVYEFRQVESQWRGAEVNPASIATRTSVPLLWLGVGLGGLVAIGALMWARLRLTRRARALAAARPGILGTDGWIALVDGTAVQIESPSRVPPGPVVLFAVAPAAPYRGSNTVSSSAVVAGTLEEQHEKIASWLLSYNSTIISVASLAGAPLLAAALAGLIF